MSFHLSKANIQQFSDFDKVLGFAAEEEKRLFRLPLKGFLLKGAKFFDDAGLGHTNSALSFNTYSFNSLCNLIGTTPDFMMKLSEPGLTSTVLNNALGVIRDSGRLDQIELVCDEETQQVVGIVSEKYLGYSNQEFLNDVLRCIDPAQNTDTLFPTLGKFEFQEAYSINTHLFVRIKSNHVHGVVKGRGGTGDDISTIGMQMSNSMAGGHAVRLSYFIQRLICANGLTVKVAENEGRVIHTGTRKAFLERLQKGTGSILGSLANAKRLIEDLGNLNFNAESLAKFADKKEIFSIIPNLDLAQECKDKLRGKDYSEITDKAEKALQKTADEIGMIPHCLGGSEALAVFTSHWRDNASMYDFINVFTEHAKSLDAADHLHVEEKAGDLADWIVKNKRRFRNLEPKVVKKTVG